jgi:hypothetical protein
MLPKRSLLLLLAAAAAAPSTAAAAERTIATVETPTRLQPIGQTTSFPVVDAHDGRVVWSDYDAAADVWRLKEYSDGAERALPVRPRSTPFDVDLGPDGRGGTVAVYSRCRRALPDDRPAPDQTSGRAYGCDLYAYSFGSERERRLGAASGEGDEAWPAVWGSRIAFVRTYPDRAGRRGRTAYLYWRPLGRGKTQRLRRPSAAIEVNGRPVRLPYGISGLDMRGRTVTYAWERFDDASTERFVWLATTGGALRAAARGATTGGGAAVNIRSVGQPALGAGRLHWLFQNSDEPEYFGAVLRGGDGRPQAAGRSKAVAFAHDGATAYWVDGGPGAASYPDLQPGGSFALVAEDALTFGAIPRGWLPVAPPR